MGLFDKKEKNTTLMLTMMLFEDFDHPRPGKDRESAVRYAEEVIKDVLKLHYYEALRPPKKWNYDFTTSVVSDFRSTKTAHLEFRDPETMEIVNHDMYKEITGGLKSKWKAELAGRFPKYSRNKLEDGFEQVIFDYFPSRCLIVASMLLDDIMKVK